MSMMGQLAALDGYDPNGGFGLSPDEMTARIARDPTDAPTERERSTDYRRSAVGQMQDYYRKAPDDIWKQADDEVMNRDLVPDVGMNLFAAGPQEAPQVARAATRGVENVANWVIPQSPTDAAFMFALGPVGGKLARTAVGAAGLMGELVDPAEAGVGRTLMRRLANRSAARELGPTSNWKMGGVADEAAYPPPTGSFNPLNNVAVTFRGKQPKEFTPDDWQAFGQHYGADNLGPLSPLQTLKDASGKEFQLPGGTEGKWTYYDLLHMKANPINPADVDRALHGEMQRKLGRTMTPDPLDDAQVWNGLSFGMTSPNNPLLPNQLTASRLRLRSPEMLDDLASMIPWKAGEEVPAAQRKLVNDQIAQRFSLGAAPEGLGTRGTTDYSRVAEMAQMFRENPAFFRKQPDESWLQAVERITTQLPGLSAKTGSFGTVWQDPATAAISAIDRHMAKELEKRGGVFADQAERKNWQDRAVTDWNRKYPDQPVTDFDHMLTQRGSDGYIGERLMNHINQPSTPLFRYKTGEINPDVPEHLANADWVREPKNINAVGRAYKQALDVNQSLAKESGLNLFMSQWMEWDRIRNRFEPHENMFPGLSKTPALSVEQMREVANQHKLTGHKTYTKVGGQLPPTRPLPEGLPSSMGYLGMGGVAALPTLWPQGEGGVQ